MDVSPGEIVGGLNLLVALISSTFRRAVAAVVFVKPWSDSNVWAGIVLVYIPCSFEVTVTVMVHVELGKMVPPAKSMVVPPGLAVRVGAGELPHPTKTGSTGLARKTFVGRTSVRFTPVRLVVVMLLRIVMASRLVPPAQIRLGLKPLLTVGAVAPTTVSVALAGSVFLIVVPPPDASRAFDGIVFTKGPVVSEVTLTDTVQKPTVEPT
jgi:hypothetical protein